MESKDYERHSEITTIPPAHVALIAYPFGSSRGLSNLVNKSRNWYALPKENLQTRIKPLSNDSVRHIRRQNTTRQEERQLVHKQPPISPPMNSASFKDSSFTLVEEIGALWLTK
jgi:hypothetical protein